MFYIDENGYSEALRFGDVISGFIEVSPIINDPASTNSERDFKINVIPRKYFVVLTPCCSIAEKMLAITPLISILPFFYNNPYWEEDLTRINKRMKPEYTLPPEAWKNMNSEEQEKRLSEGEAFAFVNLFIYMEHPILPRYEINHKKHGKINTGFYMINFKQSFKVDCDKIINAKNCPYEIKCLQLTNDTRNNLREKISDYFLRKPVEELAEE
jgi:hypothetical protein